MAMPIATVSYTHLDVYKRQKHTIARVRNPEYRRDDTMLKREIGLDMLINPDLGAAQEIARILSFPAAFSVEPFAGGLSLIHI